MMMQRRLERFGITMFASFVSFVLAIVVMVFGAVFDGDTLALTITGTIIGMLSVLGFVVSTVGAIICFPFALVERRKRGCHDDSNAVDFRTPNQLTDRPVNRRQRRRSDSNGVDFTNPNRLVDKQSLDAE